MANLLLWLVALQALGLITYPLVYRACSRLPDRGWSLAKPLGLVFAAYGTWLIGLTDTLPNSRWTVLIAIAGVALVSSLATWNHWREPWAALWDRAGVAFASELAFFAVFLAMALLRAWIPDISHTEQPMDFMILNSTVASPHYPPNDAWLAGFPVSYYYFGYLMIGMLSMLTGIATPIAYNLGLATIAGLGAIAVFGVTFNVVRLARGSVTGGMLAGLAAIFLLLIASNLGGTLEVLHAAHAGSNQFWYWIGVNESNVFQPQWWWWRPSRVVFGAITEFPYFSFILGDLHPHVMSIPFLLLAMGLSVQVWLDPAVLHLRRMASRWPLALVSVLAIGALGPINLWDLPLGLIMVGGAFMLNAVRSRTAVSVAALPQGAADVTAAGEFGGLRQGTKPDVEEYPRTLRRAVLGTALPLADMLMVWVPFALAAVAAFLPFYLGFESNTNGIKPLYGLGTRPLQLGLAWGTHALLLAPALALLMRRLLPSRWEDLGRGILAAGVAALPVALWLAMDSATGAAHNPGQVVVDGQTPSHMLISVVPMAVGVGVALYGAMALAARRRYPDKDGLVPFLLFIGIAVGLILGTDLFYVNDTFQAAFRRMNTVFKLYYEAWIIGAVLGGSAIWYVISRLDGKRLVGQVAGSLAVVVLLVAFGATAYYPVTALASRLGDGRGSINLNGESYIATAAPAELQAIQWIQANTPRDAVVLQAAVTSSCPPPTSPCSDYTPVGFISAATGRATVIGWYNHEFQWRPAGTQLRQRETDVRTIYQTTDPAEAMALLNKYHVDYVVIGPQETAAYGTAGIAKFQALGKLVFQFVGGGEAIEIIQVTRPS